MQSLIRQSTVNLMSYPFFAILHTSAQKYYATGPLCGLVTYTACARVMARAWVGSRRSAPRRLMCSASAHSSEAGMDWMLSNGDLIQDINNHSPPRPNLIPKTKAIPKPKDWAYNKILWATTNPPHPTPAYNCEA